MKDKLKEYCLRLNKKIMGEHPEIIKNPDNFLSHIGSVYDISRETAENIRGYYPEVPLNIDEVAFAGGIHDIGRILSCGELGQLGHEIRSAKWAEENRIKIMGGSFETARKIAQSVRSHGTIYEQWNLVRESDLERFNLLVDEFGNMNPYLLVPRTWEEAIIFYSDVCNKNGKRVSSEYKIKETIERYSKLDKPEDVFVVKAHQIGKQRMINFCKFVEDAASGKLDRKELSALFGFL